MVMIIFICERRNKFRETILAKLPYGWVSVAHYYIVGLIIRSADNLFIVPFVMWKNAIEIADSFQCYLFCINVDGSTTNALFLNQYHFRLTGL